MSIKLLTLEDSLPSNEEKLQLQSSKNHEITQSDNIPEPPPEGGMKAWLVLCAASCIMSMSFGMCNSFGVYQTYYEKRFQNVPSNIISIIGALQAGLTLLMAVPSTIGMFYVGPQIMVAIGAILACLSFMFLSIAKTIAEIFIIQGLMFGLGSGIMYVHATGVTFQYFNKKKALAQGIITAGASLGGVYWPIGINQLIDKVGFHWANRIIGFIYIGMAAIGILFLNPRIKPKPRQPGQNFLRINFNILLDWQFLIVAISWFLFMLALFPGLFYIDLFCLRAGVNTNFQQYTVAIINACACIFRVLPGFIADKLGKFNIIIPGLLLSGIFPLAMWIPATTSSVSIAFVILWACATGIPVAIFPPIIGQLFNGNDISSYLSFFFVFGGFGNFLGPIIGGTFIPKGNVDTTQGFDKLAIFCGTICLGAALLMTFLRFMNERNILVRY